jgi:PhzF family phenazine biosynthesis protein
MKTGEGPELWQAAVFCSDDATGNPTGVVLLDEEWSDSTMQRTARWLGYPDTVFLRQTHESLWQARSFSPAEELVFCVQTLLAARSVLGARMKLPLSRQVYFQTSKGRVVVSVLESQLKGVFWVDIPRRNVAAIPADATRLKGTGIPSEGEYPELALDAGRRRLYRRLPNLDSLFRLQLSPFQVMELCRSADLHGLCYFAQVSREAIALRVFTTSLDGREDAATGGAVGGLLVYLEQAGLNSGGPPILWTINQGIGSSHQRGVLFGRQDKSGDLLQIGGRARLVAHGHLIPAGVGGDNQLTS